MNAVMMETPIGLLALEEESGFLVHIYFLKEIPADLSFNETPVLSETKKLTKNITPKILAIVDYLIKQGANYDYTFKNFKSYERFMLENEILSRIPESTLTQKSPIVSIYLSSQEVNDLCLKYNVSQDDILKTIEIFANIDIKFASISFNGKKIQIDKNGRITKIASDEKRNKALTH